MLTRIPRLLLPLLLLVVASLAVSGPASAKARRNKAKKPKAVAAVPAGPAAEAAPQAQPDAKAETKPATPTAAEVATGIEAYYAKIPGFQAKFNQVVTKKGLKKGLQRQGSVWVQRGDKAKGQAGKMRWDYPTEEIFYFCDGEILWSYERRERLAVKVPVRNSQVYQATGYLTGESKLDRDFAMQLVDSSLPGTWALKLTPKSGTQVMRSLTLVVDQKTFAVQASRLVDPIGDTTDLVWKDVQVKALPADLFQWTPPAGVTVKDLSQPQK
jgi:chaperone LolA